MRRSVPAAMLLAGAIGAGAAVAAQGSDDGATAAGSRPPHYCPRGDSSGFNANRLIGRRLPQARDLARAHDCTVRVVRRDGEGLIVTQDFSPTRIDVGVWDGRVRGIDGVY
jgi:hypothetical protein